MPNKIVIISDTGLDGAFAITLALLDPNLEVLGLAASAGNVSAEQATRNVQTLIEQIDPPRWPRLGAALPVNYDINATRLHGLNGLGGVEFACAQLHHLHNGDKLITDLVRQEPNEVTVLVLGPATVLARAFDRDPELVNLLRRVVMLGGTWHEPGDADAMVEFHFRCDPEAARQVLRSGVPITLLPLDVTRKIVLSPSDLLRLSDTTSPAGQFLRKTMPHGISATAGLFGIEGLYMQDVLGIIAVAKSDALTTRSLFIDVETRGELTRGVSVFDARWGCDSRPNADVAMEVDVPAVRRYIAATLGLA